MGFGGVDGRVMICLQGNVVAEILVGEGLGRGRREAGTDFIWGFAFGFGGFWGEEGERSVFEFERSREI